MRGRQVVLEQKSTRILLFFYSLKGKRVRGGGKKKEISEKKMKNIVETELKVCVLSRMKIYIAERKAPRQILHPSKPPHPPPKLPFLPLTSTLFLVHNFHIASFLFLIYIFFSLFFLPLISLRNNFSYFFIITNTPTSI